MLFVGFDISTNCTGYTVLDHSANLIDINYIDTSKGENWFDKAMMFKSALLKLNFDQIGYIAIEEILSKFSTGRSSAKTIITLARFNALASYFCLEKFRINPTHINILRARSLADCKVPRGEDSKKYTFNIIDSRYNISWPKKLRKDEIADCAYDMADSCVIALAAIKNYAENKIIGLVDKEVGSTNKKLSIR